MSVETIHNHQIPGSNTLIVRDGELFDIKLGVGCFNQSLRKRYEKETPSLGKPYTMWLPQETYQVAKILEDGQSVLIRGDLGCGKSAIVFGLRAYYRSTGTPYYYVDGHFGTTPYTVIERKIGKAKRDKKVVIWDSTDYLLGKSRKVVRGKRVKHQERSSRLLSNIYEFIKEKGRLVATTHLDDWMEAFCDPKTANGAWQNIVDRVYVHQVRGTFDNPRVALQFYQSAGLATEQAMYMASLGTNGKFYQTVSLVKDGMDLSEKETTQLLNAPDTYKSAKLFSLDPREDARELRQALKDLTEGKIEENQFLTAYALFTIRKNRETQAKKGLLSS